jgi:hypothetical protein
VAIYVRTLQFIKMNDKFPKSSKTEGTDLKEARKEFMNDEIQKPHPGSSILEGNKKEYNVSSTDQTYKLDKITKPQQDH